MKRVSVNLLVIGLLLAAAPGAVEAKESGDKCSIEGTWYGFNGLGETFVVTIMRTGSGRYSAVGQAPAGGLPYPEVEGYFDGVQGDLVRTGPGTFDSSWMVIWKLEPDNTYWEGFEMLAVVPHGEVWMTGCNSFEALFGADLYLYNFGDDPLEDGFQLDPVDPFPAYYKRLPRYEP